MEKSASRLSLHTTLVSAYFARRSKVFKNFSGSLKLIFWIIFFRFSKSTPRNLSLRDESKEDVMGINYY